MKTILITIVASVVLTLAAISSSRLKKRTWDEYYPNLRQFDWDESKILFDHEEEARLKSFRDSGQFRRDQRARLDLAIEFVGRAWHNSRLSYEWNNTEWRDMVGYHLEYEPAVVEAMRALRKETRMFKWIALSDLAHMWLLSLLHFDQLRFLPVPSIAARRKVFSADILQSYERVRQAAANFARLAYGEDEAKLILARM